MLRSTRTWCATCARGGRVFVGRYRGFLLEPGTLFTLASLLLLAAAITHRPGGVFSSGSLAEAGTPLYIAAALVGSVYIWFSAVMDLKDRDFTADIPVSIATAAAIAIGEYSAAAIVAVLLLVGGMLEEFVAARAGRALEALLPETVTLRSEAGDREVPLSEVVEGAVVLVRPGERVAVDGEVVSGGSSVNQATITGESVPVNKDAGDEVFAGTLNEAGALEVRAAKVGSDTTLGRIRTMVEHTQEEKAPVECVLDRYAKVYTPAALLLGGILWWWSGDVLRAITMLIVFCPCVMVLATPTALVASIGNAALRGSLVKRGATVEAAAKVDTVAFDKTGTLTFGESRLVETLPLNGLAETEALRLAASTGKYSEHPIGRAAGERSLAVADPEGFESWPGIGVGGVVEGRRLLVGRPGSILGGGRGGARGRPPREGGRALRSREDRRNAVVRRRAGRTLGLRRRPAPGGPGDRRAPERARTPDRAGQRGQRGDGHAHRRGARDLRGPRRGAARGQGPGGRRASGGGAPRRVRRGRRKRRSGARHRQRRRDDGPRRHGRGDRDRRVGLLSDDLSKLPHLLGLSKSAMRAIRQNFVFSLGSSGLRSGSPSPGILTPVTGALLHELSSIPVIANSARLIRLKETA